MTSTDTKMRVKCNFCGSIYDYNMNACPACGAGNDKAEELDRKIYDDQEKAAARGRKVFILIIVLFLVVPIGSMLSGFVPLLFMNKLIESEVNTSGASAYEGEIDAANVAAVVEQRLERLKSGEKYMAADQEERIERAMQVLDNIMNAGYISEYEIHRGEGTISYHYTDGTEGVFEL